MMKDKEIQKLIKAEEKRQEKVINLIPSENYASKDVLTALGSIFDNKYAEGYPSARYYGGQTYTDKLETICQERALKLFKLKKDLWHANVQPLSGSPANLAVYLALVPKGGKVMGLPLSSGGHLTHGQKVSITGKVWEQLPIGLDLQTELIDYKKMEEDAIREKPLLIIVGFTAYPRFVDFKKCREIADACGAYLMVDMSHFAGLVAGGAYPSPFEYADVVTTTTHKTLRGPRSAIIFSRKDKKRDDKSISTLIDKAIFPGLQGGPHMGQIAAVAVTLKEADSPVFKKYAKQIVKNAKVLARELSRLGWRVVSGGTDSHLILVDTWMNGNGIPGKEAEARLEKAGIICNKNTIPGETRSPFDPSGIRLGSPAETTRGKKEKDFTEIARKIDKTLRSGQ
ncbi:MAG: serine hydroxymethyltransferase [Candidatus Taylorbacteria bacterium RIFCSPLOWO2_12_FULL_43_20]|uniref:Serine hydroxymethyltransferase n=1 Tax=Candidatus Taylorbacteria bacterium RIFCSPLOWO2_12_FULL_43_20 TaxID=1802332 RepID=A0A1G2P1G2_9BACT|nr:MAG: serine hydroxymethyltransferase [Candidatus Taylorbacteria bacterium RIFCSPHIGHO2_01_FULL_43_120]OHA22179.1 MAG: serine hydroxymethyltransferase [Candidatus Taylorbacteria bacterium RIFCSPHIGHO2_02_FULL_43_55]OHA32262.1 MAG: serine hydroxymethyltransferase [Candidatus Taylorbacteria bacterium RIFCSPLOWO2_01_FULL_43_83]OHA41431.1 MAG: serine hydroxymethyltransferase [Candidatus Taylorbacteria bacterium RIFCSPLOWO2_12_FULL_43_20]